MAIERIVCEEILILIQNAKLIRSDKDDRDYRDCPFSLFTSQPSTQKLIFKQMRVFSATKRTNLIRRFIGIQESESAAYLAYVRNSLIAV